MIHSILILGPSGTGKSTFIRSALETLGGGLVLMAPGTAELNSYTHLVGQPGYDFLPFEDPDFLPSIGSLTAVGHRNMVSTMRAIRQRIERGEVKYPVVAIDTISAAASLAVDATLAKFKISEPPAARSTEGAAYYSHLQLLQEELMRAAMALFGTGSHLIVVGHVNERENVSEAAYAQRSAKMILPAIPGGFRDRLPAYFDSVLYSGVMPGPNNKPQHYVQWRTDPKRPTKSRLGELATNDKLPIDWTKVTSAVEKAAAARAGKTA